VRVLVVAAQQTVGPERDSNVHINPQVARARSTEALDVLNREREKMRRVGPGTAERPPRQSLPRRACGRARLRCW
jgi:hypothetical protein